MRKHFYKSRHFFEKHYRGTREKTLSEIEAQPEAAEYIHQHTSSELCRIFSPYLPGYTESDFYELEIGSAGIMRGYMARRCDKYFTLERKLRRFLVMSLSAYKVPEEVQAQVLDFIAALDVRSRAEEVMHQLFAALAMRFEFSLQGIEA